MTNSLKWGILFSTVVKATVVAKLVTPGISSLTSFDFTLREAFLAKLIILDVSFLTSFTLVLRVVLEAKLVIFGILLYTSFWTISFFTTSLSLLKSIGTGTNL